MYSYIRACSHLFCSATPTQIQIGGKSGTERRNWHNLDGIIICSGRCNLDLLISISPPSSTGSGTSSLSHLVAAHFVTDLQTDILRRLIHRHPSSTSTAHRTWRSPGHTIRAPAHIIIPGQYHRYCNLCMVRHPPCVETRCVSHALPLEKVQLLPGTGVWNFSSAKVDHDLTP